jgi:small subunit ribosomal protein S18
MLEDIMGDQDQERTPAAGPARSSGGGPRSGGPRGERRGGRFMPRPKVCQFCVDKVKTIDYKQADQLRRFLSDRGKIRPRRQTGTCARHQRYLTIAIKRARHLALLPFVGQASR